MNHLQCRAAVWASSVAEEDFPFVDILLAELENLKKGE